MIEPTARPPATDRFAISTGMRLFGYFCHEFPRLWAGIESVETSILENQLGAVTIEEPIYVAGLARSGTTILLELLAGFPSIATHRYRDFPPIWTPYLWNRFLELVPNREVRPLERPHGDGIKITPESPEAMEEAIWMRFFPETHNPLAFNRLDRATRNDSFAAYYRRHVKKLLLTRGKTRYLAKGNYNIARLGYIQELFADARFVVPVRHPVSHIASMMRQHQIFTEGQRAHAAARAYLRRVGHFEFGLDRVPVNMGDSQVIQDILACWSSGDEAEGWAAYWSHVYGSLRDQLDLDERLRKAVLIVRYEDLNARPHEELLRVLNHCRLEVDSQKLASLASRLQSRDYYASCFGPADESRILQVAHSTLSRYGYSASQ